jgi:hypothetical protein
MNMMITKINTGTPETDAAVMAAGGDWSYPLRECSRRLERQRDEAVEEVRRLKIILDLIKKEAQ